MPQHGFESIGQGGGGDGGRTVIGLDLFNADGSFAGRVSRTMAGVLEITRPVRGGEATERFTGGTFLLGDGRTVVNVTNRGEIAASRTLAQFETGGSSGSSGSAPAFSSTQQGIQFESDLARQRAREQLEQEHQNRIGELRESHRLALQQGRIEDARRFEQEIRLLGVQHRNQLQILGREQRFQERMSLLEQLTSLAERASQFQTQLGQQAVELTGQDPLRAAIGLQGGVQRGMTPSQALRGRLLGISQAQLPQVNAQAGIPGLRGQAQQFQQFLQTPIIQPAFGLAGGGVIELKPGDKRAHAQAEGTGQAILVGEAGPEVLEIQGDRIRVIPLTGQAQFGIDLSQFQPTQTPSLQALAPLFAHLGLNAPPTTQRGVGQLRRGFGLSDVGSFLPQGLFGQDLAQAARSFPSSSILQQLGIRPRLVGNAQTGSIGFINEQGQIQPMASFQAMLNMGFRPEDVFALTGDPLQELAGLGVTGVGSPLSSMSDIQPFEQLAQFSQPIVMPTDALGLGSQGLLLPAPETVAALFPQLDPTTQQVVLQAFNLAGIPPEAILSRIEAFTPTGTARFGLAGAPRIG